MLLSQLVRFSATGRSAACGPTRVHSKAQLQLTGYAGALTKCKLETTVKRSVRDKVLSACSESTQTLLSHVPKDCSTSIPEHVRTLTRSAYTCRSRAYTK